jgi:hypothetical protein
MAEPSRREFLVTLGRAAGAALAGGVIGPAATNACASESGGKCAGEVLSLPKGGGAVSGIGQSFQPHPFTGTANFSVPIAVSPGRTGFGPELSLQYSSGSGNGAFGLGWQLAQPAVVRKTDRGVPRYGDDDVFAISDGEDLVRHVDRPPRDEGGFRVTTYRPRVEAQFARIERWERRSGTPAEGLSE